MPKIEYMRAPLPEGAELLFAESDIAGLVGQMTERVEADLSGPINTERVPMLVAVMPEARMLAADLSRRLSHHSLPSEDITFNSRRVGDRGHLLDPRGIYIPDVEGRNLLVCLGRVISGQTIKILHDILVARGAARITNYCLFDQPDPRRRREPDYAAATIPPNTTPFGYGIPYTHSPNLPDYAGLPDMYIVRNQILPSPPSSEE
jgi:hypoxanthine-guanine phosphoribosyltransferase